MTSRTPERPRATRSAKNVFQAGPGLSGGDLEAQDLPVAVSVDPGRGQHDRVDDPSGFPDLHRQGVGGHERERARIAQRSVAECSTFSSRSAAIRETCDFDRESIPRVLTSLSIRRVETPAR